MSVKNLFADDDFEFPDISDREMACERLQFNTTEDIILAMQDAGINQSDLARKLGRSKSYVSQLLEGRRNMTLKTLSDIAYAIGAEARVSIFSGGVDVSHQIVPERSWSKDLSSKSSEGTFIVITVPASESGQAQYVTK
ncbi:helix-turn-helix domain-containing protein [Serratia fonticola]